MCDRRRGAPSRALASRTTDGGATWTTTASPLLSASSLNGVAARGATLMATSANGLFRSTAGPLGTFTKISGTGGLPDAPAIALAANPFNASRFYVMFKGASGGISGISSATTFVNAAVFNNGARARSSSS